MQVAAGHDSPAVVGGPCRGIPSTTASSCRCRSARPATGAVCGGPGTPHSARRIPGIRRNARPMRPSGLWWASAAPGPATTARPCCCTRFPRSWSCMKCSSSTLWGMTPPPATSANALSPSGLKCCTMATSAEGAPLAPVAGAGRSQRVQRISHSLIQAALLAARTVEVTASQPLRLQQEPLVHLGAGHRIQFSPQMHHPVVAVPDAQPAPGPLSPVLALAAIALALYGPPVGLPDELIRRQRSSLLQQFAVLPYLVSAGLLRGPGQRLGVGQRNIAVRQRIAQAGHRLQLLDGLDLSGRILPGQARSLGQHPGPAVAMLLAGRDQSSRVSLQHRHLRREGPRLRQHPPCFPGRRVPGIDQTDQLRQPVPHPLRRLDQHGHIMP